MDRDKIVEEFKKTLRAVSEEISEADALEKCKASLDKFNEVNDQLMEKLSELEAENKELTLATESLEASLAEKSSEVEAVSSSLEEAKTNISSLEEEKNKLVVELEDINKKERARLRLEDLSKDELLFSEGPLKEKQEKVVYDISDEEFASYKEDLKEMKSAFSAVATDPSDPEDTEGEIDNITPPADIDKGRASASAVIPNVSGSGAQDEVNSKELGMIMAEYIASRRK